MSKNLSTHGLCPPNMFQVKTTDKFRADENAFLIKVEFNRIKFKHATFPFQTLA